MAWIRVIFRHHYAVPPRLNQKDESSNGSLSESTTLEPAVELDAYLNDLLHASFSYYWFNSQLHMLKKLVKCIVSIQASSAPIERVFSQAGIIFTNKKTNLSEK
ncbi:unnamed protein product [Adineta ricciae]|uniref:HAT C-terminal dimerisation domain-containing protein n=1 Tax=Adineta ricciae TaxID=249248 RepID=A0A815NM90_ADIRI|nr:unnamed protein product [Adineta ricciae]CAF1438364.1 unnamed protein product [Adineta ricciae]